MDTNSRDTKTKRKAKKVGFGIADVLIILLILALAGGAVWFFFGSEFFDSGKTEEISYEVRLSAVREELVSDGTKIKVGDTVYDGAYGENIGKIQSVLVKPHTVQLLDQNTGELTDATKPGYCDVYITVTATVKKKDHSYYANDTEIKVGETIDLRLVDFCGHGYFTSVSEAEGGES